MSEKQKQKPPPPKPQTREEEQREREKTFRAVRDGMPAHRGVKTRL